MSRSSRIVRRLAVGALALVSATGALPAGAGEVIIDLSSRTTLVVEPADRTLRGVELTLTATVVDDTGAPITGEFVLFRMDGQQQIGRAVLDDVGQARITVVPPQGAHVLSARYQGNSVLIGSSAQAVHSVLPLNCADQATPGTGALVRLAYRTVLGRCPDPAGSTYWTARLDDGTAPAVMARALARSVEGMGATVDAAYGRLLLRAPDAAGRAVWVAKLRSGWTTSRLWVALAASSEFAAGGRDTVVINALVDRAFRRIVGRFADDGSRDYWHGRFSSGAPRATTLRALILTPETLAGVIRETYGWVLGRTPSPLEQAVTQTAIKARGGDWRLLAAELLGWPEASTHAQRYPD